MHSCEEKCERRIFRRVSFPASELLSPEGSRNMAVAVSLTPPSCQFKSKRICKPRNLTLYGLRTEGDLQVTGVRHVCPWTLNDLWIHRHVLNSACTESGIVAVFSNGDMSPLLKITCKLRVLEILHGLYTAHPAVSIGFQKTCLSCSWFHA
jgi:hypothetical protein